MTYHFVVYWISIVICWQRVCIRTVWRDRKKCKWNSWRWSQEYILFSALFLHAVSKNLSICIYITYEFFFESDVNTLKDWLSKSVNWLHDSVKSTVIPNSAQTLSWLFLWSSISELLLALRQAFACKLTQLTSVFAESGIWLCENEPQL